MRAVPTDLPGVVVIEPTVLADARGFFFESWHRERFAALGIACDFVQDNHSGSHRGVLRGLHWQIGRPQAKLVRVLRGEVLDVVADVRRGSASFGRWTAVRLDEVERRQVYVPPGFAHGFYVLSEWAEVAYKCSAIYARDDERGVAWDDPTLGIRWPLAGPPILSAKDAALPRLADLPAADLPD